MSLISEREKGATAIMLAITMFLIVGIAALALDLARGWNERRQDQTSADIAAVAGALSFGSGQSGIADQVMAAARMNVTTVYTDAEWDALWSACVGPPPPGFAAINHSSLGSLSCIGINPSYLWVRLPDQVVETSFGKALGVDELTTHAESTVTLLGGGGAGSLPFAIRGNSTTGELCLDTSTGSTIVPPCDGNESGSFGNIAPPLFGNEALGTGQNCSHQTSANNYVPESIAMGIDHVIWTFSSSAWAATGWSPNSNTSNNNVDAVANMDECVPTSGFVAAPADGSPIDGVYVDTGNSTKTDVTEGLMTGGTFSDGEGPRLTRTSPSNKRTVDGVGLDNNGLWKYLGAYSTGTQPEDQHFITGCDGPTIRALPTIVEKNDAMRACLEGYSGGRQIFSDDILETPRLGTAPRLWHNNLGSGMSFRPVRGFEIVYVNGLFFDDKDDTVFFPDDGTSSIVLKNFKEIEQVTSFLLHDDMVSANVHTSLGGFTNDTFQPEIFE